MDDRDQQRVVLRKYLLGELRDPERAEVADRYFVDDNFFDELLDVENELFDQYACGQLRPEEIRNFRDYLTRLPDRHTKLATAFALNEQRKQIRSASLATFSEDLQASAVAAPVMLSRWEILRSFLLGRGHLPQYVAVSILIAVLCGLAYLIISQRALRREVEQLRVEQTQTQQQARTAQENEATLRDRNSQLQRELAQLQEEKNQRDNKRDGAVLAVHVFSPVLRSTSTPDSITISDITRSVLLVLPIPEDEGITSYNAMLKTIEGQLVWRDEQTKPHKSRRGRTVSLRLPAARLTPSTYKLTLQGTTTDGLEIAHDFYFSIIRQRAPDRD